MSTKFKSHELVRWYCFFSKSIDSNFNKKQISWTSDVKFNPKLRFQRKTNLNISWDLLFSLKLESMILEKTNIISIVREIWISLKFKFMILEKNKYHLNSHISHCCHQWELICCMLHWYCKCNHPTIVAPRPKHTTTGSV